MDDFIKALGIFCFMIGMIIYSVLVKALVIFKYYQWFVVFTFPSVSGINFKQAIALSFVLSIFHGFNAEKKLYLRGVEIEQKHDWGIVLSLPWLALFVGWVFHLFIR